MAILDPYANKIVDIVTFPGITHNPKQHVGGVATDPYTGQISVLTDAAAAFDTGGGDVSGDNILFKLDGATNHILWTANLTVTTGAKYGGFQDVEHDQRGNTYVVGSWPTSILRIDSQGSVTPWYVPAFTTTTTFGYGGLAAVYGTDILLANDNASGELYRLNMSDAVGKPVLVPRTGTTAGLGDSDATYLPPRYNGTVLLLANDLHGTTVLRSRDARWTSAEQLGVIVNDKPEAEGGFVPSNIEISGTLYAVQEFFADANTTLPAPGKRVNFPLVDITAEVEALLGK